MSIILNIITLGIIFLIWILTYIITKLINIRMFNFIVYKSIDKLNRKFIGNIWKITYTTILINFILKLKSTSYIKYITIRFIKIKNRKRRYQFPL